ncbi:hypothetical protein PR003_g18560 [Phytophthora rubi]|uniref:Uncharacterized protein n=1 Tax=Phytophthora rubi TaxID=129364 RepID=A0A6A4E6I8_9STRA|nr:hypothetical protein PR001_g17717 [Phytophthora rubi]KAE9317094.1 hypothetical protein PR003_g18560 [Phytophthora rubi]
MARPILADAVAGRAWLNQQVASLPRKEGALAVPNLKLELLAHAAVIVNTWALEADTSSLIVGDVVTGAGAEETARQVYVSPRHTPLPHQTPSIQDSLWATRLSLCNVFAGVVGLEDRVDMVVALGWLLHFRELLLLTWKGRRMSIDASALSGSLWQRYTVVEAIAHGVFCAEWVPYLVLSGLRLFSETGNVVNPKTRFWSICTTDKQLKDIVHWTWCNQHYVVVPALSAKITKTMRRHVGYLMQLLLLNYPNFFKPGAITEKYRTLRT